MAWISRIAFVRYAALSFWFAGLVTGGFDIARQRAQRPPDAGAFVWLGESTNPAWRDAAITLEDKANIEPGVAPRRRK